MPGVQQQGPGCSSSSASDATGGHFRDQVRRMGYSQRLLLLLFRFDASTTALHSCRWLPEFFFQSAVLAVALNLVFKVLAPWPLPLPIAALSSCPGSFRAATPRHDRGWSWCQQRSGIMHNWGIITTKVGRNDPSQPEQG